MEIPRLNFPDTYDFKIRKYKDKFFIYDVCRKIWLLLTPEEWVRQHWIQYFITGRGYATSAFLIEKKLTINTLTKRSDIILTEKAKPVILIECKAPHIRLSEKTLDQTARYNSEIGCRMIVLSNGQSHIFAEKKENGYQFLPNPFF
ncbi:type I restriction enzyme HsdR N-terminal domain-containing protein [Cruoricaptor ignavus]|uniref:Type I restriction enzyme HsdR N-terminal domain-containing protein n=1 Tax=Cruoricaptor ignavus TaxID=1118202 RepID=A0A7M1T662_9FLAO|nr:type I restriction enzyme HsdR N-terminal domain-containing protein [Cruoricaptor ignavus]QOR74362.1 type I restriction enzyme HsdR N-terminal domain-containing protein [Cruoricaptor ignavus]